MVEALVFIYVVAALVGGAVLVVRQHHALAWQRDLVAYELRFPRCLAPEAVAVFFTSLSGLVASRFERSVAARAVVVEVVATEAGISHYLLTTPTLASVALAQLRAAMPDVVIAKAEGYEPEAPTLAGELALSTPWRTLRVTDPAAVSSAVLSSLQPLKPGEVVRAQWVISPLAPPALLPSKVAGGTGGLVAQLVTGGPLALRDPEALRAARAKQASPLFGVALRLGATATPARSKTLLRGITAAFHSANAPGVRLTRRRRSAGRSARDLIARRLPLLAPASVFNAVELAALVGFPVAGVSVAGLTLGGTRQLPPSPAIPTGGRVVARSTYPGLERPLALAPDDALRHLHVIGPTGAGKSTLLLGLITQDMQAGRGVALIEPKGDLVDDVLERVPKSRLDDVVVLDPTDDARPVGLNLLAGASAAPELVVDQVVGIFHQLFKAFWGPRSDDVMRSALLTLAHEPGMTLCEVPLLLTDAGFRRRLVGRLDDAIALEPFWSAFEAMSEAERAATIAPLMNKLRAFLLRRRIRNVIGQAQPKLDFDALLAERRILLVPLKKGLLGEEAAALLGSLLVARLWWAVMGRAGLPQRERHPVFAYVDEFQDYINLPSNFGDLLAQARGLGLGLTLAHQHLGQLPAGLREGVLANARSRVIFQTSATDARLLAREMAGHLEPADLQGLGSWQVVTTLVAGGRVSPPATAAPLPPPETTGLATEPRERARVASSHRRHAAAA